jgi:hypothetical protein
MRLVFAAQKFFHRCAAASITSGPRWKDPNAAQLLGSSTLDENKGTRTPSSSFRDIPERLSFLLFAWNKIFRKS